MFGINPFKDWWKPSNYTAWWAYLIGMPIMGIMLLYLTIHNGIYRMFHRGK